MELTATIKMNTKGKIHKDEVACMKPKSTSLIAFKTMILSLSNKIILVQAKLKLNMYNHKTNEGYFSCLLLRCENRNEIQLYPFQQQGLSPKKDNDTLVLNFNINSKHF